MLIIENLFIFEVNYSAITKPQLLTSIIIDLVIFKQITDPIFTYQQH